MKFIPILFSTIMVQALLANRKHMTRREVKASVDIESALKIIEGIGYSRQCPYGQPGDVLYVREMHYRVGHWVKDGISKKGKQKWKFVADKVFTEVRYFDNPPPVIKKNTNRGFGWYKRNSLFMPKSAARIFLLNEGVKAERLQDISEEDAIKEGVAGQHSFLDLWIKINGLESYKANPYVWAITFKKIDRPANFLK